MNVILWIFSVAITYASLLTIFTHYRTPPPGPKPWPSLPDMLLRPPRRPFRVEVEPRDVWVGYYRSDTRHHVCPLPCLVVSWWRR